MSVSVSALECSQMQEVLTLFNTKGAFTLDEYVGVGTTFKVFADLLKDVDVNDKSVSFQLEKKDVSLVFNALNVCTRRTPIEIQNYKALGMMFDRVSELVKQFDVDMEEKPAVRK